MRTPRRDGRGVARELRGLPPYSRGPPWREERPPDKFAGLPTSFYPEAEAFWFLPVRRQPWTATCEDGLADAPDSATLKAETDTFRPPSPGEAASRASEFCCRRNAAGRDQA